MRLAISNIAWDVPEDEEVARLLNSFDIDAIDVAPGKYFPDPANAEPQSIARVKSWWAERGVEITGMQSLLFGTTGLNLFDSPAVQQSMLTHLAAICRIGGGLGATRLVFGSPKNRDRGNLDDNQAQDIAVSFFRRLGDIAATEGVLICLEPNPPCYGANFMTTSAETAVVVKATSHAAIRMQLDTGAVTINQENVASILAANANLIGHIHASEPDLLPIGDGATDHDKAHAAVKQYLPTHVVSLEMVATRNEPHVAAITRALQKAIKSYRANGVTQ